MAYQDQKEEKAQKELHCTLPQILSMRLFFIALVLLMTGSQEVRCQQSDASISISGIVLRLDGLTPIPSANIYVLHSTNGVRSSETGLFSIDVKRGDTVIFSAVGSKSTMFVVQDTLKASSYSIIQRMPLDTINLDPVEITSWPSIEQFNQAFTQEFGYDMEYVQANKNSNPTFTLDPLKGEAHSNFRRETAQHGRDYSILYENAHIPLEDVLNPRRWDKLVKSWKTGQRE